MQFSSDDKSTSKFRWILRRSDQAVVAALVAAALFATGLQVARYGVRRERLIEIDRAPRQTAAFVVDVNEADWPELTQIPGIGETLARRIVESRGQQGAFLQLNDLRRVQGIGPATLERMRPFLMPIPDREMVAGP